MPARPWYSTGDVTIHKANVLTTRTIGRESIDLVVTSPPYNVDTHCGSRDDRLTYPRYLRFRERWPGRCFS
jgi:site-specific DNA-methyltransferase (adenine-specific)